METIKYRYYSLDVLKLVAILFITNSHFVPIYKDVCLSLATFGVHGNALFFFVSGYLIVDSFMKKDRPFVDWFLKKIRRLWPAVLIWCVVENSICGRPLSWENIILISDYWFLRTIIVYFAIFYFWSKIIMKKSRYLTVLAVLVPVCVTLLVALLMPKAEGSIYHTTLHYYAHFSVMSMGGIVCMYKDEIQYKSLKVDTFWLIAFFVIYFVIMSIGKGRTDVWYYTQLLGLIPIHAFCYFAFKVCNRKWCNDQLAKTKFMNYVVLLSSLSLEIYIVQFNIITDKLNSVFPLNLILVFICICMVAYVLKVLVNIFLLMMGGKHLEYREIMRVV